MIRLIAFAAFALAVATSAQAMSPPPLPQPDGISAEARYRGVARGHRYGVARGHRYGVARGYGHRRYGYGGYGRYGYRGYGYRGYRPGYGVVAAKPAGARYGVQATFAVDGYIETPTGHADGYGFYEECQGGAGTTSPSQFSYRKVCAFFHSVSQVSQLPRGKTLIIVPGKQRTKDGGLPCVSL